MFDPDRHRTPQLEGGCQIRATVINHGPHRTRLNGVKVDELRALERHEELAMLQTQHHALQLKFPEGRGSLGMALDEQDRVEVLVLHAGKGAADFWFDCQEQPYRVNAGRYSFKIIATGKNAAPGILELVVDQDKDGYLTCIVAPHQASPQATRGDGRPQPPSPKA